MVKLNELFVMSIMFLGCFACVNGATTTDSRLTAARKATYGLYKSEKQRATLLQYNDLTDQTSIDTLADFGFAINSERAELTCMLPDGSLKTIKLTSDNGISGFKVNSTKKHLGIQINGRYIWVELAKLQVLQTFCDYGTFKSLREKWHSLRGSRTTEEPKKYDLLFQYRDENDDNPKSALIDGSIVTFHVNKEVTSLNIVDNDDTYLKQIDDVIGKIKENEVDIGATQMSLYLCILADRMQKRGRAKDNLLKATYSTIKHITLELEDNYMTPALKAKIKTLFNTYASYDPSKKNPKESPKGYLIGWQSLQGYVMKDTYDHENLNEIEFGSLIFSRIYNTQQKRNKMIKTSAKITGGVLITGGVTTGLAFLWIWGIAAAPFTMGASIAPAAIATGIVGGLALGGAIGYSIS